VVTIPAVKHGSDFRRFLRGEWTRCVCGFDPRDNEVLGDHFAEHGFAEVDDHGHIIRVPLPQLP
jgi:hypothetical protein